MQYEYRPLTDQSYYAPQSHTVLTNVGFIPPSVLIHTPPQSPLSQEEAINGEIPKTCARCALLYKREDDLSDACQYHPGIFQDGRLGFWTCCKQLVRGAAPCQKTCHVEDVKATSKLRHFMQTNTATGTTSSKLDSCMPAQPYPSKVRRIRAEATPQDGFVTHVVLPVDTIEGVCLRYDITLTELSKYNRGLTVSSFPAFRTLLIPVGVDDEVVIESGVSDAEKIKMEQEKMRIRFQKTFKVSPEIATSYLSSNDFDFEAASQDYQDDLAFEASLQGGKKAATSRTTKFDSIPSPVTTTRR